MKRPENKKITSTELKIQQFIIISKRGEKPSIPGFEMFALAAAFSYHAILNWGAPGNRPAIELSMNSRADIVLHKVRIREPILVVHDSVPQSLMSEPCCNQDKASTTASSLLQQEIARPIRPCQEILTKFQILRTIDGHFSFPLSLFGDRNLHFGATAAHRFLVCIMTNTTLIAIGVVIPLTILIGAASAFIWHTERKRKQNVDVREIPHRPRVPSGIFSRKTHQYPAKIEDGIEVCSPRPSIAKPDPPVVDLPVELKAEYELPRLQIGEARSNSAVQSPTSPTDTFDLVSELEGTLGKQPFRCPSRAKLRHSSDEHYIHTIARKEVPNRASLQPQDHYQDRYPLQPIATSNHRVASNKSSNEALDPEPKDGTSSPTVSAISELSGGRGGRSSARDSDVPGE